ncbi:MAG: cytochrome C oxidase subunit IV family protein [Sphingomonadales bacterium]|nr:cytochrome C oxidase subunit IV family protein [Sphingomonadales bacterium]
MGKIPDRYVLTWLILVTATALSSGLSVFHTFGARGAGIGVLAIAFAKIALIMSNFMEIRHGPLALRLLCYGWLVVVLGIMCSLYGTSLV